MQQARMNVKNRASQKNLPIASATHWGKTGNFISFRKRKDT